MMHADEIDIDETLVGRLVAARFPRWADLPITPVPSAGTDNTMYRLGDEMAVPPAASRVPAWTSARGWAVCFGVSALRYYRVTNPVLAGIGRRAIEEAVG